MTEEKAKILVVDDARRNVELMQAMLTLAGYEVLVACDGEQALQMISQQPPDLILLDAMMPKLNGYEICARLKANDETRLIPVILIISPRGVEGKIRAIEAGSDDLLEKPVSRVELLARVKSLVQTKRLNDELVSLENAILALAIAIEAKDPYTEGHVERVSAYTLSLASEIGLYQREQRLLRKGSILHDVGKIGVKESVLLKRGTLSQEEFEHLKIHPVIGERICQPLRSRLISDLVRHHHERYDGKGYPDGLAGEKIPLAARIMAIADAYDALTTERPYRRRLSVEEALAVLKEEAGKQFDAGLVSIFIELVEADKLWYPLP
jgi:putative two-component system response regulator